MKIIAYCKAGYHAIKLMMNPDSNIKSLIYLGDQIANARASKDAVDRIFQNQMMATMYNFRTGLNQLSLPELKNRPESNFGREIYEFYTSRGLDVYPMKTNLKYGKEVYVSERIRKTHDFLHVLLGYDTDLIGEAKVNAFVASQTKMPMSFLILAGIIIKYFFTTPLQFRALIDGIIEGWNSGYDYHPFLIQDWERLLTMDTSVVKRKMMKSDNLDFELNTISRSIGMA